MDIEQPSLYCACFVESCQTSPIKREKRNFGIVTRLFVSYLFVLTIALLVLIKTIVILEANLKIQKNPK
jgi:hypothetical protein